MFTAFLIVLALAVSGFALIGLIFFSRRFGWLGFGAVIGVIALVALFVLFWQHAVLAVAIISTVFLALGVTLQKVEPVKAITGAVTALILFFVFSWLAVQLADTFLFNRESNVEKWLNREWDFLPQTALLTLPAKALQVALGIACLAAAAFLNRIPRAVLVFIGILLLALQFVHLLEGAVWATEFSPLFHDPLVQLSLVFLSAAFAIRFLIQSLYSDESDKKRARADRFGEKDRERGP